MYFRNLLVAVLLACAYGYETHNSTKRMTVCKCFSGERGSVYYDHCGFGYQYCGETEQPPYICCLQSDI